MSNKDNFEELTRKLKNIDNVVEDRTPSDFKIKELIIEAKIKKQNQFYFELAIFMTIAVITLASLLSVTVVMPIVIIASQVLALAAIPIAFWIYSKREKSGERVIK